MRKTKSATNSHSVCFIAYMTCGVVASNEKSQFSKANLAKRVIIISWLNVVVPVEQESNEFIQLLPVRYVTYKHATTTTFQRAKNQPNTSTRFCFNYTGCLQSESRKKS